MLTDALLSFAVSSQDHNTRLDSSGGEEDPKRGGPGTGRDSNRQDQCQALAVTRAARTSARYRELGLWMAVRVRRRLGLRLPQGDLGARGCGDDATPACGSFSRLEQHRRP